jgi:hypothetical protein
VGAGFATIAAMGRRPPRARTERRARRREVARAVDRLERLAAALPGGARDRPLEVPSASVVMIRARAARCLRCDGELEVRGDSAEGTGGEVLRRVSLACRACHAPREMWLRIVPPLPS